LTRKDDHLGRESAAEEKQAPGWRPKEFGMVAGRSLKGIGGKVRKGRMKAGLDGDQEMRL